MPGFRYALPDDELRQFSVAASDQSAAFPAANVARPEYWLLPYLSRGASPPQLTFDFAPSIVSPVALYLNDVNFSTFTLWITANGVTWTEHSQHLTLLDPRVGNRGKCLIDANLPTSTRWIRFIPSDLQYGQWSYRIGGLLWLSQLRTFAEPCRPPLEWEAVRDTEVTPRRGASAQVAELGVTYLRYPQFGSETNRRLVGGSLTEWQTLLNIGQARPFLFVEPFGNEYCYYVRRVGPAPVAERLVTFGASMTMEEML